MILVFKAVLVLRFNVARSEDGAVLIHGLIHEASIKSALRENPGVLASTMDHLGSYISNDEI